MFHPKRLIPLSLLLLVPAVVGAGSLVIRAGSGSIQAIGLKVPPSPMLAETGFRKMNPEEVLALRTIQENGRRKVADLTANATNLSDSERNGLDKQVFEAKTNAELEFLRTCLRFAQARGNRAEIEEAEQALRAFEQSLQVPSPGSDSSSPPQQKDLSRSRP